MPRRERNNFEIRESDKCGSELLESGHEIGEAS
jgi:hypothetical protein